MGVPTPVVWAPAGEVEKTAAVIKKVAASIERMATSFAPAPSTLHEGESFAAKPVIVASPS
jgi:hypothetical protein